VTVIVMNSFGPASSAHIVTGQLLRLVAPRLPSFACVIFMKVAACLTAPIPSLRSGNHHSID
jgi:hypothetical protein